MRCKVSATRYILLTASVSLTLGPVTSKLGDRPLCVTHASPAGWMNRSSTSQLQQKPNLASTVPPPGKSSSQTAQVSIYGRLTCSSTADAPQPPHTPAKAPVVLLYPQPAQHGTCSAQHLPEAALEPHVVRQHPSHLWEELTRPISRPISCTRWRLGILSFKGIPANSDLRQSLWTLTTLWILASASMLRAHRHLCPLQCHLRPHAFHTRVLSHFRRQVPCWEWRGWGREFTRNQ